MSAYHNIISIIYHFSLFKQNRKSNSIHMFKIIMILEIQSIGKEKKKKSKTESLKKF